MSLSQQQLDDLLERLIGLTDVQDAQLRQARLAQLVLLLIQAIGDAARVQAVLDDMQTLHGTTSLVAIP